MMADSQSVRVSCRFRPMNKMEQEHGGSAVQECVEVADDRQQVTLAIGEARNNFTFDRSFTHLSSQQQVYEFTSKPQVHEALNGYNCTIFAYGQTGSGKTHTMMGPDIVGGSSSSASLSDDEERGIIPRIADDIFLAVMQSDAELEFTIKVSFVEIYMERIRDLLNPRSQVIGSSLKIREDKQRGITVEGATQVYCGNVADMLKVVRKGSASRAIASTRMNQDSSRSHSVFIITIGQRNVDTSETKTGKLTLVDLAGSEMVKKTKASNSVLEEAKMINKSLSALGNVIKALVEQSKHIPYRDSKLTRLLQDSLGGNSKTSLIITASCSPYNATETLSTLRFGQRAKQIKNKPKVNKEYSITQYRSIVLKHEQSVNLLRAYIIALEGQLGISGTALDALGVSVMGATGSATSTPKSNGSNDSFNGSIGSPLNAPLSSEQQVEHISSAASKSIARRSDDVHRERRGGFGEEEEEEEDIEVSHERVVVGGIHNDDRLSGAATVAETGHQQTRGETSSEFDSERQHNETGENILRSRRLSVVDGVENSTDLIGSLSSLNTSAHANAGATAGATVGGSQNTSPSNSSKLFPISVAELHVQLNDHQVLLNRAEEALGVSLESSDMFEQQLQEKTSELGVTTKALEGQRIQVTQLQARVDELEKNSETQRIYLRDSEALVAKMRYDATEMELTVKSLSEENEMLRASVGIRPEQRDQTNNTISRRFESSSFSGSPSSIGSGDSTANSTGDGASELTVDDERRDQTGMEERERGRGGARKRSSASSTNSSNGAGLFGRIRGLLSPGKQHLTLEKQSFEERGMATAASSGVEVSRSNRKESVDTLEEDVDSLNSDNDSDNNNSNSNEKAEVVLTLPIVHSKSTKQGVSVHDDDDKQSDITNITAAAQTPSPTLFESAQQDRDGVSSSGSTSREATLHNDLEVMTHKYVNMRFKLLALEEKWEAVSASDNVALFERLQIAIDGAEKATNQCIVAHTKLKIAQQREALANLKMVNREQQIETLEETVQAYQEGYKETIHKYQGQMLLLQQELARYKQVLDAEEQGEFALLRVDHNVVRRSRVGSSTSSSSGSRNPRSSAGSFEINSDLASDRRRLEQEHRRASETCSLSPTVCKRATVIKPIRGGSSRAHVTSMSPKRSEMSFGDSDK